MAWLKKNVFTTVVILLLVAAVAVLALEAGVVLTPPQAEQGQVSQGSFENRDAPATEPVKAWPNTTGLNDYELGLVLDPVNKQMSGTLNFTYTNAETVPMSELHFLLYANSHEKESYNIFEASDIERAYPNGFSPGSIKIESVTAVGSPLDWVVGGEQNEVLKVHLPGAVKPGGTSALEIKYTVNIPNCYGRFGYGKDTMSLVNCNPILSVYDEGKWFDYPYYNEGDPFYSETANFHATITAPKEYTIAATGVLTERENGNSRVWTVEAPARRDFGFITSDRFDVAEKTVDGVLVRSYYIRGNENRGRAALDTGAESIALYDSLYGQYPYSEFSVAQADFFIGGMEYPGLVLIDGSYYKAFSDKKVLDLIVAHETGHQWWYSTIGDDEVMTPWLDEGLTEFTTQVFFEKRRDKTYNDFYDLQIDYMASERLENEASVTDPSYKFTSGLTYSAWVYDRTAAILQELRGKLGDEKFFTAMKQYYNDNRLGITTREDLEKAFEDVSGEELTQWFEERFSDPGDSPLDAE